MSYKTIKVSDETVPDLSRALWIASRLNFRDGIAPAKPEASQAESLGRIIREWSADAITGLTREDLRVLVELDDCDWQCAACGSTGLNRGGLRLANRGAWCVACIEKSRE